MNFWHKPKIYLLTGGLIFVICFLPGCTPKPRLLVDPSSGNKASPTPEATMISMIINSTATKFPGLATGAQSIQPTATSSLNCTYTLYYWKNSPTSWLTENIIIGRLSYTKIEAQKILGAEAQDETVDLLQEFFGAALNILKGADPSAIEPDILTASNWLDQHPVGADLTETDRQEGVELSNALEAYNNGEIGPGPCSDEPNPPTTSPTLTPTSTATANPTRRASLPSSTATPTQKPARPPGSNSPTNTPQPTPTPPIRPDSTPTSQPAQTATPAPKPTNTKAPTPTSAPTETPQPTPTSPSILPTLPLPDILPVRLILRFVVIV